MKNKTYFIAIVIIVTYIFIVTSIVKTKEEKAEEEKKKEEEKQIKPEEHVAGPDISQINPDEYKEFVENMSVSTANHTL